MAAERERWLRLLGAFFKDKLKEKKRHQDQVGSLLNKQQHNLNDVCMACSYVIFCSYGC